MKGEVILRGVEYSEVGSKLQPTELEPKVNFTVINAEDAFSS